jgi:exonuclease V gamma subunit
VWADLLLARGEGLRRPLPLAWGTVQVWLAQKATGADDAQSREKARAHYEGGYSAGERDRRVELERVFPEFDALWGDGAFVHWTDRIAAPLDRAIPRQDKATAKGKGRKAGKAGAAGSADSDDRAEGPEATP